MRSKQQIKEALRVVAREEQMRQWNGGDLAVEYLDQSPGEDRKAVIVDLADDVGLDAGNLDSWERVARAYPPEQRDFFVVWTCYRQWWRDEDRHEKMLKFSAHCRLEQITTNQYRVQQAWEGKKPTSEFTSTRAAEQAELAFEMMPMEAAIGVLSKLALEKPGVFIQAAKHSPAIQKAVAEANYQQLVEQNKLLHNHHDPFLDRLHEGDAVLDLLEACNDFTKRVDEIMPRLGSLPGEDARGLNLGSNRMLREALDAAEGAFYRAKAFITTGRSDIDSFIGSVLRGAKS